MGGNYHIGKDGKWRWNQARRGYGFVYFRVRHSLGAAHWVAQWARWKTINYYQYMPQRKADVHGGRTEFR